MDITKIGRDLGWEPRQWLESGLQKTIAWYLDNPVWITAIQQQAEYQEWVSRNYEGRG
jgi:dTDP-glucose 4,6-dehydratase